MIQEQRRVKIGKYLSIAIGTLVWFITAWIINSVSDSAWVYAIVGIIMLIVFTSLTFGVLSYSTKAFIKAMKTFKQEKMLWKILTIVFRIAMFVFALLITVFWLVWFIFMLKNAMFGKGNNLLDIFNYSWHEKCALFSKAYISGSKQIELLGGNNNVYPLFITSFVFILIWSAAGIVFEILKKITGGYKDKKNDDSSKKVEE